MWLSAGFLIALNILGSVSGDCDSINLRECVTSFARINPSKIFRKGGTDVNLLCQSVGKAKRCIADLASCISENESDLYIDAVKMVIGTVSLICEDDNSTQRFEESSRCYQENFDYIRKCYELSGNVDPEDIFSEEHCKEEETWSRCFIQRFGEKCNKKSCDFVIEIFTEFEKTLNTRCNPKVSIVANTHCDQTSTG